MATKEKDFETIKLEIFLEQIENEMDAPNFLIDDNYENLDLSIEDFDNSVDNSH